jgi:hypothetical protein
MDSLSMCDTSPKILKEKGTTLMHYGLRVRQVRHNTFRADIAQ